MVNLNIENRTLFLELFTEELILNSRPITEVKNLRLKPKGEVIKNKKQAKEKKATPLLASEFNIQEELPNQNTPIYNEQAPEEKTKMELGLPNLGNQNKTTQTKPAVTKIIKPARIFQQPKRILLPPKRNFTSPIKATNNHIPNQNVGPVPGLEVDLGKISMLALDQEVTVIECPGPEKFVLVKKAGKINLTKIKLSQEDINDIITAFSDKARIPLMNGIFKAIIGEITIKAIIADSVCYRFMIYKKTPYSIIQ